MHRWRISFTVLLVYSRHFPKPEPDPKPRFCGLPNPEPGFSKKAPGLESLVGMVLKEVNCSVVDAVW